MLIDPTYENPTPDIEKFAEECEEHLFHRGKPSKAKTWKTRIKREGWLQEIMKHTRGSK